MGCQQLLLLLKRESLFTKTPIKFYIRQSSSVSVLNMWMYLLYLHPIFYCICPAGDIIKFKARGKNVYWEKLLCKTSEMAAKNSTKLFHLYLQVCWIWKNITKWELTEMQSAVKRLRERLLYDNKDKPGAIVNQHFAHLQC